MATIKNKRGTRAALDASPGLQQGELGLCTDTGELFIGNNGNHPILEQVAAQTLMGNNSLDKALPSPIPADDVLSMIGGQAIIQYEVMPASVTEGAVIQYVGEDTENYVRGSWYRGEHGDWILISGSGGVYVGEGEMPDGYNVQIDPSGEVYDPTITVDTKTDINGILSGNGTNVVGLTPTETRINIGAASNPNLLDNWDFRNPVNQRGLTSYEASGTSYVYTIDRWRAYNSTVNVIDGALSVTASDSNNGYKRINQIIDRPLKAGTIVTASCAISQATATNRLLFRLVDGSTGIASKQVPNISEPTILTLTFKLTADLSSPGVEFLSYNSLNEGWSITITAAKLEIGTVSTLENDPPMDYAREFEKCLYYFKRIYTRGATGVPYAVGKAYSSTSLRICFSGGKMRTNPSISFSGTWYAWGNDDYNSILLPSDIGISTPRNTLAGNTFAILLPESSALTFTVNEAYYLCGRPDDAYIDFSCDL